MSLRKQPRRSDANRKAAWGEPTSRNVPRLVFWLVLFGLLGGALVWSVSRNRDPSLRVDLSVDQATLLTQIAACASPRQLQKLQTEAAELLLSAEPQQIRPILEIADAAAERLVQLEKRPESQAEIFTAQLALFRDLSRLNLNSLSDVHWQRLRFNRLSSQATAVDSVQLQRAARQARLLEWQLQLIETQQPLTDLADLDAVLSDLLRDSPVDPEVLTEVEQIWERSPTDSQYLPQLQQLTETIEKRLSASGDPEAVRRGKRLVERYWMVAWNLQERVEQAVLARDREQLAELQRAALELLQSNPTREGIGLALRLAAALEGEQLFEAAAGILQTCQQLSEAQIPAAELAEFQRLANQSLERLKLFDQTLVLELETLPPPGGEQTSAGENATPAHTVVLQFIGQVEELESLETFCSNLQALRPKGYRLVLVPCDLSPEQLEGQLLREGQYRFEILTPAAAAAVQQTLHQSSTPRTMVLREGKLIFSGLPNRRLYLDLEREAFSRSQ